MMHRTCVDSAWSCALGPLPVAARNPLPSPPIGRRCACHGALGRWGVRLGHDVTGKEEARGMGDGVCSIGRGRITVGGKRDRLKTRE